MTEANNDLVSSVRNNCAAEGHWNFLLMSHVLGSMQGRKARLSWSCMVFRKLRIVAYQLIFLHMQFDYIPLTVAWLVAIIGCTRGILWEKGLSNVMHGSWMPSEEIRFCFVILLELRLTYPEMNTFLSFNIFFRWSWIFPKLYPGEDKCRAILVIFPT